MATSRDENSTEPTTDETEGIDGKETEFKSGIDENDGKIDELPVSKVGDVAATGVPLPKNVLIGVMKIY